jgi:hypothetical protein
MQKSAPIVATTKGKTTIVECPTHDSVICVHSYSIWTEKATSVMLKSVGTKQSEAPLMGSMSLGDKGQMGGASPLYCNPGEDLCIELSGDAEVGGHVAYSVDRRV